MFRRFRQLRISLATKCQLLFGAAVVLIVAATLSVPWRRIEQLTEQLNERAAGAVADHTIAQHAKSGVLPLAPGFSSPAPAGAPAGAGAQPHGAPTSAPAPQQVSAPEARLLPLEPRSERNDAAAVDATRFERRALAHFARHPEALMYSAYYDREDGTKGYRYARPLTFDKQRRCADCHTATAAPVSEGLPTTTATEPSALRQAAQSDAAPATAPDTRPSTGPARAVALSPDAFTPARAAMPIPLEVDPATMRVGIVSVDIGSRIDMNELLINRSFMVGAGMLAGTLAIVTFYLITTRLILQPVRVLQETAEKVARGDLNIRADISTGDEFQQLSETFNVMLANLKQGSDQLKSINKSLDLKLGQLAETNVALYESNRLKSEFLANVSHELRTPLNSILGFAELLKDALGAPPDAKTTRYVNNIRQSGKALLELINDLLDLAKIEAGRMEIRSEPLVLSDLFEGLTTVLRPLADPRKVQIVASVAPDVPIVYSDPGKLQQVLYNFLSNAIKFSPEGGQIDMTATLADDEHVRIAVADRGPGIAEPMQAVIFEKFRQIDGSVTRTHSGTGLGLAISKELTVLMGGTIGVDSAPGDGATFWVLLPLKTEPGQLDVRGKLVMA